MRPVGLGRSKGRVHLGAPKRRCCEIFVQAGLENNLMGIEIFRGFPQLLVICAKRRTAVACNQPRRVEAVIPVETTLHHRQPHKRLDAGHEGCATLGGVDGF